MEKSRLPIELKIEIGYQQSKLIFFGRSILCFYPLFFTHEPEQLPIINLNIKEGKKDLATLKRFDEGLPN
jgi:hypothetical protein